MDLTLKLLNSIGKHIVNGFNKFRPDTTQVDINEYNEKAAKCFIRCFNKQYDTLSSIFSMMENAHLENTQTYLDMKDKLNKLSIDQDRK